MQIHDLNTKALTDPAYVAFDDGTDTYKVEFNDTVESAAQSAVTAADLTQNTVGFTSGDSLSPSGWTPVSQITTNSTLATLFNRISTMVKNVRYIWNLLGSSSFSNVASTLTGAIGNTALTTTAQTLSGAIAEHERDISGLNSNFESGTWTPVFGRNTVTDLIARWYRVGSVLIITSQFTVTDSNTGASYITGGSIPTPSGYNRNHTTMNGSWHANNDTGGELGQYGFNGSSLWFSKGGSHFQLLATIYSFTAVGILTKN